MRRWRLWGWGLWRLQLWRPWCQRLGLDPHLLVSRRERSSVSVSCYELAVPSASALQPAAQVWGWLAAGIASAQRGCALEITCGMRCSVNTHTRFSPQRGLTPQRWMCIACSCGPLHSNSCQSLSYLRTRRQLFQQFTAQSRHDVQRSPPCKVLLSPSRRGLSRQRVRRLRHVPMSVVLQKDASSDLLRM